MLLTNIELPDYCCGDWQLERNIYTKSTAVLQATAQGMATFTRLKSATDLQYSERGKIRLLNTDTELGFSRRFRYGFNDNELQVLFDDGPDAGSLYQVYTYDSREQKLIASEVHLCGPDQYQGEYHFLNQDTFRHSTLIDGKAKDMLITTIYTRLPRA